MALKRQLRTLEEGLHGTFASFVLEDGGRHYYDPQSGDCFLHSMACLRAQGGCESFPEPPETLKVIARARDRRAAFEQLYPMGSLSVFPYEAEALVERGELVPRSMVAGREPGEPIEDLSEP